MTIPRLFTMLSVVKMTYQNTHGKKIVIMASFVVAQFIARRTAINRLLAPTNYSRNLNFDLLFLARILLNSSIWISFPNRTRNKGMPDKIERGI